MGCKRESLVGVMDLRCERKVRWQVENECIARCRSATSLEQMLTSNIERVLLVFRTFGVLIPKRVRTATLLKPINVANLDNQPAHVSLLCPSCRRPIRGSGWELYGAG